MSKKFFNTLFVFLIFLPLSFVTTSCSDDDDQPVDITGYWCYGYDNSWIELWCENGLFHGFAGIEDDEGSDIDKTQISGTYTVSGNQIEMTILDSSNPSEDFDIFEVGTVLHGTTDGNVIILKFSEGTITLSRDDY